KSVTPSTGATANKKARASRRGLSRSPRARLLLRLLVLLDQILLDLRRHLVVVGELHRELGLALGGRAQLGRVAEHLRERDVGIDHAAAVVGLGADDGSAAADQG